MQAEYKKLTPHLLSIIGHECGVGVDPVTLVTSCRKIISNIDSVVCSLADSERDTQSNDPTERIPDEFFKRNEEEFRGLVSVEYPAIRKLYQDIELVKSELVKAVESDFPSDIDVVHDIMNNAIHLKEKPADSAIQYIHPIDRNHKPILRRSLTLTHWLTHWLTHSPTHSLT